MDAPAVEPFFSFNPSFRSNMLDALNAFFLATTLASQVFNIVAQANSDVKIQDDVRVYAVAMRQQTPYGVEKCHYDGVMVQYARDWDEVRSSTGIVSPPEPDKPIGYALILTKEKCPGKDERPIFSTGSKFFYPLFGRGYVIREGHRLDATDYASQQESMRPKWMPQVLKTIEADAPRNIAAQNFVAEMMTRTEAAKAPETAKGASATSEPVAASAPAVHTKATNDTKPAN